MIDCTAIIVAGGEGKRMGGTKNKIFLDLNGIPVLAHTLLAFENCPLIKEIVLVSRKEERAQCADITRFYGISKISSIVPGGDQRQRSVYNGLKAAGSHTKLAAIHDAARPFVSQEDLSAVIRKANQTKAATLGVRTKDTIKICSRDQVVMSTPVRDQLWVIQTPQVFEYPLIMRAHETVTAPVTDDCSLVEAMGVPITVVEGSYSNLKLTTPEDVIFASALVKSGLFGSVSRETL